MRILLSNDDGILSDGIAALYDALSTIGEVWVVAPEIEQSAASHAITLYRPLRIKQRGPRRYAVDGTPTDCVYIALNHLMKDCRPDVVCSGINHGPNLGNDVIYSGTVAAAMEGAILGVSAIAFSLAHEKGEAYDFAPGAAFAAQLTKCVAENPLPRRTLLNVNFPARGFSDYAVTILGKRNYGSLVAEKTDPRGKNYYWIGGEETKHDDVPGSDCNAVFDYGLASITPVSLDLTDSGLLGDVAKWKLPGYRQRTSP